MTDDALLDGRVRVSQPKYSYRVGIDPVLLAAAAPAKRGDHVLDLGAGVGAAALCLAARIDGASVVGLEIEANLVTLATDNAKRNGYGDRVSFLQGDILDPPPALAAGRFDHAIINPPFLRAGVGRQSPYPGKSRATVEGQAHLSDWLNAAVRSLRPGGTVTVVHRADRLDAIVNAMAGRNDSTRPAQGSFGELTVFPLWPGHGRAARRIIVAGRKGSRGPSRLVAGLVLHEDDGSFTDEAQAVLRHGGGIALWERA